MENNNINEVMKSLSELYAKKEYKKAQEYIEQNSQAFDTGSYLYNLGTLKAKSQDFAYARFYYERALKEGYRSEALLNNLGFVKSKLAGEDLSNSVYFEDRIQDTAHYFPMSGYVLVSVLIFFIAIVWMKLKRSLKLWKLAIVFILALSPIFLKFGYINTKTIAVALKEVEIYEGPSTIFEKKGSLKAGAKIRLGKVNGKWAFVTAPQSQVGWVSIEQLGIL